MLFSYAQIKEKYGSQYQIDKVLKDGKLFQIEKGIYSDKKHENELFVWGGAAVLCKY